MCDRLLSDGESSAKLDYALLDRTTRGIVDELIDIDGDVERYRETVRCLALLTPEVMWWVDLAVAAEMVANEKVMREPVGVRKMS